MCPEPDSSCSLPGAFWSPLQYSVERIWPAETFFNFHVLCRDKNYSQVKINTFDASTCSGTGEGFTEQNKPRLVTDSGNVPGLSQVKGISSIIEYKCCFLLSIASNTIGALLAQVLIANSDQHLGSLFTWGSCLSLSLCCKAKGKPRGNGTATHLCIQYSITSSRDKIHQY